MIGLRDKCIELINHLSNEKIVNISLEDIIQAQTLESLSLCLKLRLHEAYPKTKLKKIMKSIHYSNGFSELKLKEIAYTLDDVEQYLSINGFLNHDKSVEFFNHKISSAGFTVNPITIIDSMLESLFLSKGKEQEDLYNAYASDKMDTCKAIFTILDYVDHLDKSKSGYTQNGLLDILENWGSIDEEKYSLNTGAIVIVRALKEYARSKNEEAVTNWIKELDKTCTARNSPNYGKNCIIGKCYFELGKEEKAFEYLNLSYQEHPSYIKSEDKKYLEFILAKM